MAWDFVRERSDGGGATTVALRPGVFRFKSRNTSGGGATIASFEKLGGVTDDFRPSAGGGPGTDL